jgi:hypothetical protein
VTGNKRHWPSTILIWMGIALVCLSLLLGLTPLQWLVEKYTVGVPDEYYPEYFWLAFGLPVSALVLLAGSLWSKVTIGARVSGHMRLLISAPIAFMATLWWRNGWVDGLYFDLFPHATMAPQWASLMLRIAAVVCLLLVFGALGWWVLRGYRNHDL